MVQSYRTGSTVADNLSVDRVEVIYEFMPETK